MDLGLQGFSDSSFADDCDERKSTCGFVFMFAGGPICWKSGRQPIVALSTTEAEYIAMTLAAKEAAAVRQLLRELQYCGEDHHTITMNEDNLPAIDLLSRTSSDGSIANLCGRRSLRCMAIPMASDVSILYILQYGMFYWPH